MKIDIDINKDYTGLEVIVRAPEMTAEVTDLMQRLKNPRVKNLVGKDNQKMFLLNPRDVLLLYSKEQKVFADTMSGTYEVKQKLYELEEELRGDSFVRISKFAIVNVDKIRDIEVFFNGSLVVNLINSKQEFISRRYVSRVREYLGLGGK
jgi:DNA-binding LytR/AlgR family response regulator